MALTALWTPEEASWTAATVRAQPRTTLTWQEYKTKLEFRLERLMVQEGMPKAIGLLSDYLAEGGDNLLAGAILTAQPAAVAEMVVHQSQTLMNGIGLRWEGKTPLLVEASVAEMAAFNGVTLEIWAEEALL